MVEQDDADTIFCVVDLHALTVPQEPSELQGRSLELAQILLAVGIDPSGADGWLLQDEPFDSIHPSLQQQAIINMAYGLYEVVPGKIYQVRGFDLANISFIKGDSGWIVIDPLTCRETARAALDFINETIEKWPVVAVIYSHSHGDHFGRARGVVE